MAEQFANQAASVLAFSLTQGATSLSIQSAANFPTQGNFAIAVDSGAALEYMIVTAVSGTTFTVTRGAENTTAVAHNQGVAVTHVLTARSYEQGILDRVGTAANLPGISLTGDATGSGSGGSIATTVGRINGASVPVAGSLTTGNVLQATGAAALGYGAVNLAGGSGYVTGTLPAANLPSLAGDVTGTITSNAVASLSGSSGTTSLKSNLAPDADGTRQIGTASLRCLSVVAGAFSVYGTAGDANPVIQIQEGSATAGSIVWGAGAGNATDTRLERTAAHTLTLDDGASGSAELSSPSNLTVNAATGLYWSIAGSTLCLLSANGIQLFGSTAFGGGTQILGLSNSLQVPTSIPAGGIAVYAQNGQLGTTGTNLIFNLSVNGPGVTQDQTSATSATPSNGHTFTVQAQSGQSGGGAANANSNGGNLVLGGGPAGTGNSGAAGIDGAVQLASLLGWSQSASTTLAGSNVTLSQPALFRQVFTGTMTASISVTFPNRAGIWLVDLTGLTFSTFTLTLTTGSGTTVALTSSTLSQKMLLLISTGSSVLHYIGS